MIHIHHRAHVAATFGTITAALIALHLLVAVTRPGTLDLRVSALVTLVCFAWGAARCRRVRA